MTNSYFIKTSLLIFSVFLPLNLYARSLQTVRTNYEIKINLPEQVKLRMAEVEKVENRSCKMRLYFENDACVRQSYLATLEKVDSSYSWTNVFFATQQRSVGESSGSYEKRKKESKKEYFKQIGLTCKNSYKRCMKACRASTSTDRDQCEVFRQIYQEAKEFYIEELMYGSARKQLEKSGELEASGGLDEQMSRARAPFGLPPEIDPSQQQAVN